jgi:O-antigen/teichoic acid export membrane protein
MPDAVDTASAGVSRGKRFIVNVFWNWLGVGVGLFSGFLLSPYLIYKLGPEGYGIWALSFALIEYYWFVDLGFRTATVKYGAHYWARGELEKVSEVVSTGLLYSALIGSVIFALVISFARYLDRFFQVSSAYRETFLVLITLISVSWCLGIIFSPFAAFLEGVQRYDLVNRTQVAVTGVRAVGTAVLLYLGYGLVQIGILVVGTQLLGYGLQYYFFRVVFPAGRISFRQASMPMLKQMGNYGIHNFVGNISIQVMDRTPPVLIGHYLPADYVGFYSLPLRLLQYTGEVVSRIGIITNSNAAELAAKGETTALTQLAIYTNRYCLVLFMPLALLLATHGGNFFELWVPKAAQYSAPLLPVLLAGYVIAVVGQFSSGMLLMGLARFKPYSRGLLVEAVLSVLALIFVIPRYGILGAACVSAALMVINRGLFLPWLVSRVVHMRFVSFMSAVYSMPLLAALPVGALAWLLHSTVLPGANWYQIFAAATVIGTVYYALAFAMCLPRDHKALVQRWAMNRLRSTFAA